MKRKIRTLTVVASNEAKRTIIYCRTDVQTCNKTQAYSRVQVGIFFFCIQLFVFLWGCLCFMCSLNWNGSPQIAFHYSQSESILFLSPQKSERTVAPRWHALPQGFHTVSTHQDNHCVLERIRRRKKERIFLGATWVKTLNCLYEEGVFVLFPQFYIVLTCWYLKACWDGLTVQAQKVLS